MNCKLSDYLEIHHFLNVFNKMFAYGLDNFSEEEMNEIEQFFLKYEKKCRL